MPERNQEQFTDRRRAILEGIIADDSDRDAQDFLCFSFMCALRSMYELFVLEPEKRKLYGIEVTDPSGLGYYWNEVGVCVSSHTHYILMSPQILMREMESFRSGAWGNAEAPLVNRLVAFVRSQRTELEVSMGVPMPPGQAIERRLSNNMRIREQRHKQVRAETQIQELVPRDDGIGE